MANRWHIAIAMAAALLFTGCEGKAPEPEAIEAADESPALTATLYHSGRLYTLDAMAPWAEALAVHDGRIVAVGSEAEVRERVRVAEEIDLGGRLVLPGFIDAHVHAAWGGIKDLYWCNFPFTAGPEEVQATIARCVEDSPDVEWIIGGQWTSDFFVTHEIESPRAFLDAVSGDKAVILSDDSGHNDWANTRALELIGMTADTPDPPGAKIWRDENGHPTGVLMEASYAVRKAVPPWTLEQYTEAARYANDAANGYGIVGFKDASATEVEVAAYRALEDSGELSVYVAASLYDTDEQGQNSLDVERYRALRERFAGDLVGTGFVKIFLDGVPTASRTAAMLEPYVPDDAHGAEHRGALHVPPEQLADALAALDAEGFTVKIHTAGDRAVRVALDAIEHTRQVNGDSGLRHELAHAGYVHPDDIPRFAELDAVADFSPYIWTPSPIIDSVVGAVGEERGREYWPTRALLDAGAPMLVGSDWPSAVPNMDPWAGLEGLITRKDPHDQYPGAFWPEQAVGLEEALRLFTIDGARALRIDDRTGSLEAGKSADFIVLDRDLFSIDAAEISEVKVVSTVFRGQEVYRSEAGAL